MHCLWQGPDISFTLGGQHDDDMETASSHPHGTSHTTHSLAGREESISLGRPLPHVRVQQLQQAEGVAPLKQARTTSSEITLNPSPRTLDSPKSVDIKLNISLGSDGALVRIDSSGRESEAASSMFVPSPDSGESPTVFRGLGDAAAAGASKDVRGGSIGSVDSSVLDFKSSHGSMSDLPG